MSKLPITERNQADGITNLPTLTDLSESIQFVVPQEDRDFSRPRNNFQAQSLTSDMMNNDDGEIWVEEIQKFMKNNPISPPYIGPIDGEINRNLLDVLLNFSWTLKRKTGKTYNIVSGNSINQAELQKALSDLQNHLSGKKVKKPEEEEELPEDKKILAFQELFSSSQPLVGTLYEGPKDGKINPELIQAAKAAESQIADAIDNEKAHGMIFSGNKFITSPSDVSSALNLIEEKKNIS